MKKALFLAILGIMLLASTGFCDDAVVEAMEQGQINWTKGTIRVTGMGLPPKIKTSAAQAKLAAKRAAKLDAYRRLAEIVNGVRVNAETTVENLTLQSSKINTKVKGFVKGARETDIKYYTDGAAEITIEAALNGDGGLSDIILPSLSEARVIDMDVPLAEGDDDVIEEEFAQEEPDSSTTADSDTVYSGLVIDSKGLGVQPALSPKILTEDDQEVYGVSYADPTYRTELGLVEYHSSVAEAKENKRVSAIPYIIRGIKVTGSNKSDIVITTDDALEFQEATGNDDIVERCRVIIVLE